VSVTHAAPNDQEISSLPSRNADGTITTKRKLRNPSLPRVFISGSRLLDHGRITVCSDYLIENGQLCTTAGGTIHLTTVAAVVPTITAPTRIVDDPAADIDTPAGQVDLFNARVFTFELRRSGGGRHARRSPPYPADQAAALSSTQGAVQQVRSRLARPSQ